MSENIQPQADQSVNTGEQQIVAQPNASTEKTYTQDEVNGLVAKESKKAQEKFLKDLGIEDFKSAKEGFAQLKAYQDSQKTEAEKQNELLNATNAELEQERAKTKELTAKLSATQQGVNSDALDDVIALAERLVSDEKDIDTAIKEVLVKYPHFTSVQNTVKEPMPTITVGGNPNGESNNGTFDPFEAILNKYK